MALTKKYRCNKQNFINADAHNAINVVADCQSFYPIVSCLLFVLDVSLRTKNTRRTYSWQEKKAIETELLKKPLIRRFHGNRGTKGYWFRW